MDIRPLIASANGAAADITATLAAQGAHTLLYLEGFSVTGGGATGATTVLVTISGLAGGNVVYAMNVLAGATGPVNAQGGLSVRFPDPLPAAAENAAITITVGSFGDGNTAAAVNAYGHVRV